MGIFHEIAPQTASIVWTELTNGTIGLGWRSGLAANRLDAPPLVYEACIGFVAKSPGGGQPIAELPRVGP